MAQTRTEDGKYGKKKRGFGSKLVWLVVIIIIVGGSVRFYQELKTPPMSTEQYEKKTEKIDELTVEERARLQKMYDLSEKEIVLKKQKAKLDQEYNLASGKLEGELEAVRKEKLDFTQAPKL